jgi:hypothetical protein
MSPAHVVATMAIMIHHGPEWHANNPNDPELGLSREGLDKFNERP